MNLTKAVHIDDTAYLEMARAILADPLHPMSGEVNWQDSARPIHELNQPPLFSAFLSLVMLMFGESELALHSFMALIAMATIFLFHRLARMLVPQRALLLTTLFVLSPAFLPGQNLMVDVPLIAFWLAFFWGVIRASSGSSSGYYLVSATALAAACLVKYSSLALMPVLLFAIGFRRHWSALWCLTIPLSTLLGWSAFNHFDYGGVHLLERQLSGSDSENVLRRAVDWIAGLGAVAPFTIVFLAHSSAKRTRDLLAALGAGAVTFLVSVVERKSSWQIAAWWALFVGNGILVLTLVYRASVSGVVRYWRTSDRVGLERNLLLLLWILSAFTFVVLFAPFMAIRHILLVIPGVLLILGGTVDDIGPRRRRFGLVLTALLGVLLARSDYDDAEAYRRYARSIREEIPSDARVWYLGHWGWQWYAEKAGMRQYDTESTVFSEGDYVVVPSVVHRQVMRREHERRLTKVREVVASATPWTWLRTMSAEPWGGYYAFSIRRQSLPWRLSHAPLETFSIFTVAEAEEE